MTESKFYRLTIVVEISTHGFEPDAEDLTKALTSINDGRALFPAEQIEDGLRRLIERQMSPLTRDRDHGYAGISMPSAHAKLDELGTLSTICHACGSLGYGNETQCARCGGITNESI